MTDLNAALHIYFSNSSDSQMQEIANRLAVCAVCFETGYYFLSNKELDRFVDGVCKVWKHLDGDPNELQKLFHSFFNNATNPFQQFGESYYELGNLNYQFRAKKCWEMRDGVCQYLATR